MIIKYNKFGFLHSYNDQPSLVDDAGNMFWHTNGQSDRYGDLPCSEFIDGLKKYSLKNEEYKIIGNINNLFVEKYYNSNHTIYKALWYDIKTNYLIRESYFLNNNFNRLDSPAIVDYHENSNIEYQEYYINYKRLTKEQFLKLMCTLQSDIIP